MLLVVCEVFCTCYVLCMCFYVFLCVVCVCVIM